MSHHDITLKHLLVLLMNKFYQETWLVTFSPSPILGMIFHLQDLNLIYFLKGSSQYHRTNDLLIFKPLYYHIKLFLIIEIFIKKIFF